MLGESDNKGFPDPEARGGAEWNVGGPRGGVHSAIFSTQIIEDDDAYVRGLSGETELRVVEVSGSTVYIEDATNPDFVFMASVENTSRGGIMRFFFNVEGWRDDPNAQHPDIDPESLLRHTVNHFERHGNPVVTIETYWTEGTDDYTQYNARLADFGGRSITEEDKQEAARNTPEGTIITRLPGGFTNVVIHDHENNDVLVEFSRSNVDIGPTKAVVVAEEFLREDQLFLDQPPFDEVLSGVAREYDGSTLERPQVNGIQDDLTQLVFAFARAMSLPEQGVLIPKLARSGRAREFFYYILDHLRPERRHLYETSPDIIRGALENVFVRLKPNKLWLDYIVSRLDSSFYSSDGQPLRKAPRVGRPKLYEIWREEMVSRQKDIRSRSRALTPDILEELDPEGLSLPARELTRIIFEKRGQLPSE